MKRSEMLDTIAILIIEGDPDVDRHAEEILNLVEELGMLPPQLPYGKQVPINTETSVLTVHSVYKNHVWEQE